MTQNKLKNEKVLAKKQSIGVNTSQSVESSTRHHNENHNIQLDKTMKTPRVINAATVDDDINQSQEYFNVGS